MNHCVYKYQRVGQFNANLLVATQCGSGGQRLFSYAIKVEVDSLDEQDFVIDNLKVGSVFERWTVGVWDASCESLAGGALLAIKRMLGERAVRIEVEIAPGPKASMAVVWTRHSAPPSVTPQLVDYPLDLREI